MRGMFGLVSLLVVVAIAALIFKQYEAPTLERGKQAQDQVQQISGRGQDGHSAMESFKVEPQQQGSRLTALLVTDVVPGGAVDQYYGLKKGDRITQITTQGGLTKINEASNDDAGLAKALVQTAFQDAQPIVVVRDGKTLTLPASQEASAPGQASAQPAGAPAPALQPSPAVKPPQSPFDQANGLKDALQNSSK